MTQERAEKMSVAQRRDEMDAVKYLIAKKRICDESYYCSSCVLNKLCALDTIKPERTVAIVEKWVAEHPQMTNGARFIEVFGKEAYLTRRRADPLSEQDCEWWDKPYEEPYKEQEESE